MSKGDKDTRKNHKKYNAAVYWRIKELKSLAKYVEGEIIEPWTYFKEETKEKVIEVKNYLTLKANTVKAKQLDSFLNFKAEYYKVKKILAKKGKITIELQEKR